MSSSSIETKNNITEVIYIDSIKNKNTSAPHVMNDLRYCGNTCTAGLLFVLPKFVTIPLTYYYREYAYAFKNNIASWFRKVRVPQNPLFPNKWRS